MANVYKQLGIHIVTAVKYREALIQKSWRPRIESYLEEMLLSRKHLLLASHAMPDHIHVFAAMHQSDSVAAMTGAWKATLSGFISSEFDVDFEWQRGYGAFAVSRRYWGEVIRYIDDQERHHRAQAFREEYKTILEENLIDYDEQYLFDEVYVG